MKPGQMLLAIAEAREISNTRIEVVQRQLRIHGLITASGRGNSARHATYLDCATVLVASFLPIQIKDIAGPVRKLLDADVAFHTDHQAPPLFDLQHLHAGPLHCLASVMNKIGNEDLVLASGEAGWDSDLEDKDYISFQVTGDISMEHPSMVISSLVGATPSVAHFGQMYGYYFDDHSNRYVDHCHTKDRVDVRCASHRIEKLAHLFSGSDLY